jgi:L-threonylcarbamoyladenylate synthase
MNYKKDLENCIAVLKNGGVILYPTDTVWGIGCDATNEIAVAKIFALKQRAETKSMIILVDTESNIKNYAKTPNNKINQLLKNKERPTTIIYPNAKGLAKNLTNEDATVAIRIPNDEFCLDLITTFGKPIVSTSANISGENTASIFSEISTQINSNVDYTCIYRQEDNNKAQPSKIIKWNEDESITVIRE